MNVLILGEFSAFAKNLAKGINAIEGNHAVVFSDDDGFKKIEQDENSYTYPTPYCLSLFGKTIPKSNKIIGFKSYIQSRRDIKALRSYFDVVFIINYRFLRINYDFTSPYFSLKDLKYVCREKSHIYMSACGGDLPFLKFALNDKRFSLVYTDPKLCIDKTFYQKERLAEKVVEYVIPMSYQYAESYRKYGCQFRLLPAIPLPFEVNSINPKQHYCINKKICIFNGALRPTKGTYYIDEALSRIQQDFPNEVEIRNDRLPYADFLKFLSNIDLYVDLCIDYDYGMSAIAAMSAGCVVFSGNEKETGNEFGFKDIPVVPLIPDVDDIYNKISYYILNRCKIIEVGKKSREYVERYHNCDIIARQYLSSFSNH